VRTNLIEVPIIPAYDRAVIDGADARLKYLSGDRASVSIVANIADTKDALIKR
jgi:hypothetical protein